IPSRPSATSERATAVRSRLGRPALWVAGLFALLCGCAVGPDFVRPEPPAHPGYTREPMPAQLAPAAGGPEHSPALAHEISARWWELFGSGSLDELVCGPDRARP